METRQLVDKLLSKQYLRKKPLYKSDTLRKLVNVYNKFFEDNNLDKQKKLIDILKDEPNEKKRLIIEAFDDLVRNLSTENFPKNAQDYKKIIDNYNLIKSIDSNYDDVNLVEEQINIGYPLALEDYRKFYLDESELSDIATGVEMLEKEEEKVSSTPATEEQKPPPPPKPKPLPKPGLRGSRTATIGSPRPRPIESSGGAGAGAGGGTGRATPRVKVISVTPRGSTKQVEPIKLPADEQPPADPMPSTMPLDDKPLSVPTPAEVDTEPPMREPMMEEPEPAMPQTPAGEPLEPEVGTQTDQPIMSEMATQTEPNVSQQISRKVTSVADEQQPSKIDMIPKERLSAENKTEAELFDDINYFYKTFPNELKNISFDRNNRNIEYLKSKHKEIVAKLTAGKKKEEKIGIIISGSEYIKEKLKEIILENSITGLSAKDLIINVEKSEEKQSSDVNSYEFKMGADGKAMAKKEPIYKYITPVVQQPIKTKPSRIPNTQTKFRSLVTTARKEVAQNPFSKPQPKIRLKYSY